MSWFLSVFELSFWDCYSGVRDSMRETKRVEDEKDILLEGGGRLFLFSNVVVYHRINTNDRVAGNAFSKVRIQSAKSKKVKHNHHLLFKYFYF